MKLITGSFDNTGLPVLRGIISHFNQYTLINPLPNETILDWSKLKAFADDKCNLKAGIPSGIGRKYCKQRRKYWFPTFSPFPTMFSKTFFLKVFKSRNCVLKS